MARRIRNANPVTLFPFLAVLMCTIGALVLLLVVISAQIRGSAVQQFVAQQQQGDDPPVDPVPLAAEVIAEVVTIPEVSELPEPAASVEPIIVEPEPAENVLQPDPPVAKIPQPVPATDEQLALIDDLKLQAAELQTKYDRSSKELSGLTQKQDAIKRQLTMVAAQENDLRRTLRRAVAVSEQASQKLDDLKVGNRQIIELLEQSDELIKSERKRAATPKHSLVPYDGQTGTIRKPIVIECANGTIRFESEGVELDVKRLAEYPPGINPLVAGIQSLSSYWGEKAREAGRSGVAARPYALLLVRPSGADQFRLARRLLQPLVGEYGYEFVDESFAYDVPATTTQAADKCREAVEAAFQMKPRGPAVGSFDLPPGVGGGGAQPGGIVLPRGPIDVERLTQRPAASRGFFGSGNFSRHLTGEPGASADAQSATAGESGQRTDQRGEATTAREPGSAGTNSSASRESTSARNSEAAVPSSRNSAQRASQRRSDGPATLQPAQRDDTPNTKAEARSAVAEFLAAAKAIREQQNQSAGKGGSSEGTGSAPPAGVDGADGGGSRAASETDETSKSNTTGGTGESSEGETAGSQGSQPKSKPGRNATATQKRWGRSDPNASLGLERPVTIVVGESRVLIVGAYQITLRQEWSELQSVNVCLKGLDMTASDWGRPGERFYWVPVVTLRVEAGGESLAKLLATSLERLGVMVEYEPAFLESGRGS